MTSLEDVFNAYCAFGATAKTQGNEMTTANIQKMMRDNKIFDKKLTSTDIDIIFSKVKTKTERKISFKQFQEALKQAANIKYKDDPSSYDKLVQKLTSGSGPATSSATKQAKNKATDRLTDSTKYTGSHKERFDESGKGKGIEGRKDLHDASGYVSGYKEKDTYDKKH